MSQDHALPQDPISPLLRQARLLVCCGPGGVGKTTSAAALGLRATLMGRKVIVLTIDPARRLANSLGLSELSNQPQRIDLDALGLPVEEGGELWAMMLDQKKTLDDLVKKFAPDKGAFQRAQDNNIYRLLSSTLHGMQEYMALDKLHDLYTGGYFDLVVLDTPPTKNALEFLETPSRARTFFDERIIKWFLPTKRTSTLGKLLDPGAVVLKLLNVIFGDAFVKDLTEFFETLEFLQQALHTRGDMIDYILRDAQTHFLIIASADPRRMKEALYFHEKLGELGQEARAFIVNRVTPPFDEADLSALDDAALASLAGEAVSAERLNTLREQLRLSHAALSQLAARDQDALALLARQIGAHKMQRVPILGQDVHSIAQLARLSAHLTPSSPMPTSA